MSFVAAYAVICFGKNTDNSVIAATAIATTIDTIVMLFTFMFFSVFMNILLFFVYLQACLLTNKVYQISQVKSPKNCGAFATNLQ